MDQMNVSGDFKILSDVDRERGDGSEVEIEEWTFLALFVTVPSNSESKWQKRTTLLFDLDF